MRLLWRLLCLGPSQWQRPASVESLPTAVQHFLHDADMAGLERLLIETARRLDDSEHGGGDPSGDLPDPLGLHQLIQDELHGRPGRRVRPRR
ncbi:MAG: hypothetical protein WD534_11915 [Phycisphaeraceae bacterium]